MANQLFEPEINRRNVFIVLGNKAKGTEPTVLCLSNRQLLTRWILNKGLTYLDARGKPKILDSYKAVVSVIQKTRVFDICVSGAEGFEYYTVVVTHVIYKL